MKLKKFIISSKKIEKNSYIWNMVGSILVAFQSVIMLMVSTRVLDLKAAGILTIAYADANLFLKIGKYGMRNYQVSDVKGNFTFSEYFTSRIITTCVMFLVSALYILYMHINKDYSYEKSIIIFLMCLLKTIESLEDVFHGMYQNQGRLDIAGKTLALRMGIITFIFGIAVVTIKNLLWSIVIANIAAVILFIVFTKWSYGIFQIKMTKVRKEMLTKLFFECFPLFVGSFLSFYIGNAPRYAIDSILTDELQACYGFIAMPVFVIELLNNFIFNPVLHSLSISWEQREIRTFVSKILKQAGIIFLITLCCIVGGFFCGIPILSWLYGTDLSEYKMELLILLLGGGFFGMVGFLNIMNTIIRQQKQLMLGYAFMAVLAFLLSDSIVQKFQILGAAILYTTLMGILSILFTGLLIYGILYNKKTKKYSEEGEGAVIH